jgi:hypothetical protein
MQECFSSHILPSTGCHPCFLILVTLTGVWLNLGVLLICSSLMTKNVELFSVFFPFFCSFNLLFFIRYFLYLYFKCYPLSWFLLRKTHILSPFPLLTNLPTPAYWPWHSPTLGHWAFLGPRASLCIGKWQGHPLLHYSWSHESFHVYSFVGGLVPQSFGGTGGFILLFLLQNYKLLWLLRSFL